VNFSEMSAENLMASAQIAVAFGAQLVVMHAEEHGPSPSASQEQLCEGLPSDLKGRCNLVEVTRSGNAAEQILLAAREHNVDLITITARHRRLLDFRVIGTTTEKVMRHADGAVLVFRVAN
jgi:nucleotide-binding universal stress UspA family protein